ncbi:cysteine dioxygenase family protein [Pseudoxanthomonas broegbernensis]|uniref:cysteine dioxygenase family protein n=1 Tax=Pseudoxanthomonas broegbernensis TaxID=83619 RepID=UPI0013919A75|nr:cysteine dioxygenase family protein [Pseudoxanthomonas broegbernensis]MBB6064583.1 putative metal-dependent enzyme (double-stranded beta helix superfamily) [Pseudoxanthomonas broegbernensis]
MDFLGKPKLIAALDAAVHRDDGLGAVTGAVAAALAALAADPGFRLPPAVARPLGDRYARRELHASPSHGYSVVAMAWAPGQGTPIHDHDGAWCVECVWQGRLRIDDYAPVARDGRRWRFARHATAVLDTGRASRLLSPQEYHAVHNPGAEVAVSVHVYQRRLRHCHVYLPENPHVVEGEGWLIRREHPLLTEPDPR